MFQIYIVPTSAERLPAAFMSNMSHGMRLARVHVHLAEKVSAVTRFHLTANVKENTA